MEAVTDWKSMELGRLRVKEETLAAELRQASELVRQMPRNRLFCERRADLAVARAEVLGQIGAFSLLEIE